MIAPEQGERDFDRFVDNVILPEKEEEYMGKQNVRILSDEELNEAIENLPLIELMNIVKTCAKEYHQIRYQLEKAIMENKNESNR